MQFSTWNTQELNGTTFKWRAKFSKLILHEHKAISNFYQEVILTPEPSQKQELENKQEKSDSKMQSAVFE